jgi:hypothetical protein
MNTAAGWLDAPDGAAERIGRVALYIRQAACLGQVLLGESVGITQAAVRSKLLRP